MLSNPLYNGTLISRKTETRDFITGTRRPVPPGEYTFKCEDLKIISDKTYKKAAKILVKRSNHVDNRRNG